MTTLHIPKPCHENWDAMTPQERGRHCDVCDKTVVDVTRMRPSEGRRFLGKLRDDLAAGAHVCVRAHADAAGKLLAPSATRRLLTNGLAAVLAVAMAGCHGSGPSVGQAQPAPTTQTQPAQQQPIQQQAQQPTPMMGEPVANTPESCITGDVAVTPTPIVPPAVGAVAVTPDPQPQVELGRVRAVEPTPQPPAPMMGKPVAQPPAIKGEAAATPRETKGKVAVDR
jgi:hypothetical protein